MVVVFCWGGAALLSVSLVGTVESRAAESPGKAPTKLPGTASLSNVLLFPSPSELATGLRTNGIQVSPVAKLNEQIPSPNWPKLTPRQQQFQLGAILGYLAFAAAAGDMDSVAKCFDQVLAGAQTMGIAKTSPPYVAMAQMRDRIKKKEISQAKVIMALDELRRETLSAIASRIQPTDMVSILAAAWLRGSSLLARQAKTDAEAAKLGEFVMRPELIDFIGKIPETGGGAPSAQRRAAADRIAALAKKPKIKQSDLLDFSTFADTVLEQPRVTP
jgi:hypothetical protein